MSLEIENFPAILKVLVVDADKLYLKIMESLLIQCQYHVTITDQVKEALAMLKEKKNDFDIVIINIEMPDMDDIKLLQHVSLEMNLPIIAYSDTKQVTQGIDGACDYLVKPVRIEELQYIWKHVVQRNKCISKRSTNPLISRNASSVAPNGYPNQHMVGKGKSIDGKFGDDDDNNCDELEEGERKNEDTTTIRKPKFYWSSELHQKFIDAINQLGLAKAFPKNILDLMNVEGLRREQVASHLQKYRLYLKNEMNSSLNQQGNTIYPLGPQDVRIGPLGGDNGVYHSLTEPGRFYGINREGGTSGDLNTSLELGLPGLSSYPMLQTPQYSNLRVPYACLSNSPTTPIMLNGGTSLFPPSLTFGGLTMSGSNNVSNCGASQPHPIIQNVFSTNAPHDGIPFANARNQNGEIATVEEDVVLDPFLL